MRVLTTDGSHFVGYAVVRALRPHAAHVGVLTRDPRRSAVARSRHVDAVDELALPARIPTYAVEGPHNAPEEAAFVDALCAICARDGIDIVFPTSDYEVLLLAKNRDLLAERGVVAPVPPFEGAMAAFDKVATPALATEVGLPAPRAIGVRDVAEAREAARELGLPVVVKPGFSFGGYGVGAARSLDEVAELVEHAQIFAPSVVVQEYVPGSSEPSIHAVLDTAGGIVAAFTVEKLRYAGASLSTAVRIAPDLPEADAALALARKLGVRGFVTVQLKRDSRDGSHKLIEVNPRLGANARIVVRLALRFGQNLPLLAAQAAAGPMERAARRLPVGRIGVSPFEDALAIATYRQARRDAPLDGNPLPPAGRLARSYLDTYVRRRPTVDFYARALVDDPAAALAGLRQTVEVWRGGNTRFLPWGGVR